MDTCRDISALISQAMDTRLSAFERLRVRLHLFVCVHCRRFATQVRVLRAASRRLARQLLGDAPPT